MKPGLIIAGVDEAGRGPLAGPVVASAVILDPKRCIMGLKDSKLLSAKKREALFEEINEKALDWAYGFASVNEIDKINILRASLLAMQRAVLQLKLKPQEAWVDGRDKPDLPCGVRTIIGGDNSEPMISAASIMAKVIRDREMVRYDSQFPHYGFVRHKGYATAEHLAAIEKWGVCPLHRRSFAPVKEQLFRVMAK